MTKTQTAKWYNNNNYLVPALLILPPVGIYGVWKSKKNVFPKLLLTLSGFVLSFILLIIVVAIANPSASVSKSTNLGSEASNTLLVKSDTSSNTQSITGSELKTLTAFQRKWADSIVKSWEGSFITDVKLSLPDTIQFYLSKAASNNIQATRNQNLGVYQILYDSSRMQLPESLRNYPVTIDFLPAKGYKIENWTKFQTMTYEGIVLYLGLANEKKEYGTIIGGYIVNGDRYVQILTAKDDVELIKRDELNRKAFYYKSSDPKIGTAVSWIIR